MKTKIIILTLLMLISSAYCREIKKTVILTNQDDNTAKTKTISNKNPIKTIIKNKKIETPQQLSAAEASIKEPQPFFNRTALSFSYNDINSSGKPSIPYFRGYMPSKWIWELSMSYFNINKRNNFLLLESLFLYPINTNKDISIYSGAGIANINNPENKFRISGYLEIEKKIMKDINFAVQYEPIAYEIDNEEKISRFIINGSFSSKIIWKI